VIEGVQQADALVEKDLCPRHVGGDRHHQCAEAGQFWRDRHRLLAIVSSLRPADPDGPDEHEHEHETAPDADRTLHGSCRCGHVFLLDGSRDSSHSDDASRECEPPAMEGPTS
jgi:hypothetical protein